jgi:hypothetical protein
MTKKPAPMSAAQWDKSRAPKQMLAQVREGDLRKLRLFACACCRAVWDRLTNEVCRRGVEVAELFADGLTTAKDRNATQKRVDATLDEGGQRDLLRLCVSWALVEQTRWDVSFAAEVASGNSRHVVGRRLQQVHADLLRCVFGNPFREVKFDKKWRTDTVVAMARGMYESRDFGAMPILADALQDAGCENDDVLNHCRGPGSHARGCWVVDWVLGKS